MSLDDAVRFLEGLGTAEAGAEMESTRVPWQHIVRDFGTGMHDRRSMSGRVLRRDIDTITGGVKENCVMSFDISFTA